MASVPAVPAVGLQGVDPGTRTDEAIGRVEAMTSSAAAISAVLQFVEGFARIYRFSGKLPSRQKLTCQRSS